MTRERQDLGNRAEDLVAERLSAEGYEILGRNVRSGRYELDVVARKGRLLVVCEVRARTGAHGYSPAETINAGKIQRIRRATAAWLSTAATGTNEIRFDAAAVTIHADGRAEIDYFEEAF